MAIILGKGSSLYVTISAVLTKVPQAFGLKPPGQSADKMDITDLDSSVMQSTSTLAGASDVSCRVNYDGTNAVHQFLDARAADQVQFACEVRLPAGGNQKYAFTAFVSGWEPNDVDAKSKHERTLTLTPVGAVVPPA